MKTKPTNQAFPKLEQNNDEEFITIEVNELRNILLKHLREWKTEYYKKGKQEAKKEFLELIDKKLNDLDNYNYPPDTKYELLCEFQAFNDGWVKMFKDLKQELLKDKEKQK